MDLEIIILSEVKSERERQITYVYVNLKYDTNDLIYETEPGQFHGQRSVDGCRPWDMTQHTHTHTQHTHRLRE